MLTYSEIRCALVVYNSYMLSKMAVSLSINPPLPGTRYFSGVGEQVHNFNLKSIRRRIVTEKHDHFALVLAPVASVITAYNVQIRRCKIKKNHTGRRFVLPLCHHVVRKNRLFILILHLQRSPSDTFPIDCNTVEYAKRNYILIQGQQLYHSHFLSLYFSTPGVL